VGLRDRALIGVMVFTFARISAVWGLNVGDIFYQQRPSHIKGFSVSREGLCQLRAIIGPGYALGHHKLTSRS
jgi:hypothetical protein